MLTYTVPSLPTAGENHRGYLELLIINIKECLVLDLEIDLESYPELYLVLNLKLNLEFF